MIPTDSCLPIAVAVGTVIADRPPHRSVRARLRIRLLRRMSGVKACVRIRVQDTGWRNPPIQDGSNAVPPDLSALTAANQNISPQTIDATFEEAQLVGVTGYSMVLVISQHNLLEPCTDFGRAIVFPALKLNFNGFELRNHPLFRRDSPDGEGSPLVALTAVVGEA